MPRKIHTNYHYKNHIGLYLCRFLKNWNLGIRSFAKKSNISEAVLRNIINGRTKTISLNAYFQIANFMSIQSKIPVEYYLRRMKEEIELGEIKNEK